MTDDRRVGHSDQWIFTCCEDLRGSGYRSPQDNVGPPMTLDLFTQYLLRGKVTRTCHSRDWDFHCGPKRQNWTHVTMVICPPFMRDVCHSSLFYEPIIRFISSPLPSGPLKAHITGLWGSGPDKGRGTHTHVHTHTRKDS